MRKYIVGLALGLAVMPFAAKATFMGFLDGNMYDSASGTWSCQFLGDGNCYDLNENIVFSRPTSTPATTVTIPDPTPQTTYVPVYLAPSSSPLTVPTNNTPGNNFASGVTLSCTLAVSQPYAKNSSVVEDLTWTSNEPTTTTGTITIIPIINNRYVYGLTAGYVSSPNGVTEYVGSDSSFKLTFTDGTTCTTN